MAARLVALDKCPEVKPVRISELCCRLFAKLFLLSGGVQANDAFESVNICACLKAGIEVDIHTIIEQEKLRRGET